MALFSGIGKLSLSDEDTEGLQQMDKRCPRIGRYVARRIPSVYCFYRNWRRTVDSKSSGYCFGAECVFCRIAQHVPEHSGMTQEDGVRQVRMELLWPGRLMLGAGLSVIVDSAVTTGRQESRETSCSQDS